jgi:uncharacterized protein (UPF0210 family)
VVKSSKPIVSINDQQLNLSDVMYRDITGNAIPRKGAIFEKQIRTAALNFDMMRRLAYSTGNTMSDIENSYKDIRDKLSSGQAKMSDVGEIKDVSTDTNLTPILSTTLRSNLSTVENIKVNYSDFNGGSMMRRQIAQQGMKDTFSMLMSEIEGAIQNDNQTYYTAQIGNYRNDVYKHTNEVSEAERASKLTKNQLKEKKALVAFNVAPTYNPYYQDDLLPSSTQALKLTLNNFTEVGAGNEHGYVNISGKP